MLRLRYHRWREAIDRCSIEEGGVRLRQTRAHQLRLHRGGSVLVTVLVIVLALAVAAFLAWFLVCPCERTPGSHLRGERVQERVTDWRFANDVRLCQIQVRTRPLPHAINLNCMATDEGELYLSCASCEGKRWSTAALNDPRARLRLDDQVYPVQLTRVTDPAELDRAWHTRAAKLHRLRGADGAPPDNPRPQANGWWSFRVVSAAQDNA